MAPTDHLAALCGCTGPGGGGQLSLTATGDFQMPRCGGRFDVTATDLPIGCA